MQNRPPAYPLLSFDRGLTLLLMLLERRSLRVYEAAEHLGVARSTAHRLLAMLEYRGFAMLDPRTHVYRLGPVLFEVGIPGIHELDLRWQVGKHLRELADEVGETTNLITVEGIEARFLDGAEGPEVLRVSAQSGASRHAHCVAGGRALLAELTDEQIRSMYPDGLPTVTSTTISDLDDLTEELGRTRRRGYAVSIGEASPNVTAVAVCLRDNTQRAAAALAIAAPSSRLTVNKIPRMVAALGARAAQIQPLRLGSGPEQG